MFDEEIISAATKLVNKAVGLGLWVTTAESCTGGLIAGALTSISGASNCVGAGYVTYSNEAKRDMLGVPGDMIADHGAVSEPVARAMAEGALEESRAHVSVSITGIAGPGGGTPLKPVGLVHFAAARQRFGIIHEVYRFGDVGRDEVRMQAVQAALELLRRQIER